MLFSIKLAGLVAIFFTPALAANVPKRGLAANDDIPIGQFGGQRNGHGSQVNWQYNWDSTTKQKQSFAEFVPMLWGTQSYHTKQWFDNAFYWVNKGGSSHVLGFNEPERGDQANLSPAAAAAAWKTYMEPLAGHARIGAPAVSNDGYNWLSQFLQACKGCHIDFVPIHWYNDHTLENDLESWVNKVCKLVNGRKVWITEFQGFGSAAEQSAFLKKAIPFLDNNACVTRYAYFGTADNSKVLLQNGGPGLSPLGIQYAFSPYGSGNGI
ncbi:Alkali-sensitive linkage protein 1 [Cladobotryum mycophilum]|uniref:Alkali-sensitive linkage protein 1 n=1 Tax=Cladobotryum mycophilum TaxID=491253 RepID=A0ABR0S5G5_9HYPO